MHFRLPRELRPGFRIDKGILNLYTAFPKSCTSTIEVTRAGRLLIHSAWFSPMVVVCCLLQDFCGCWPHEWWLGSLGRSISALPILGWGRSHGLGWLSKWPSHFTKEWLNGFSASWESSICERKLHYPGNRTQDTTPIRGDPATIIVYCWVKKIFFEMTTWAIFICWGPICM